MLAKYSAVAKITLLGGLVYPGDLLIRCSGMALVLFVFAQLWITTYERGGMQRVVGFSLVDMVWYLVVTETVAFSAPRVSSKIDEEVKSGELTYVLLRPYSYVGYHLSAYWGEALIRLPMNLALGGGVALATVGPPTSSLVAVVAALIAVALSLTLNFMVECAIGLLAFWFEDTLPFFWVYQKLVFTLGGLFMPLALLPGPLAALASVLPFAAVAYAPGRIFVGAAPAEVAAQLSLQIGWTIALSVVLALVYRQAVRKVNIHGG
jgi:ABC-2 type transport system permease protein